MFCSSWKNPILVDVPGNPESDIDTRFRQRYADLIVNATSLGMDGEAMPSDPALFRSGQVVVDLIYRPLVTPWLTAAREADATGVNGVGMLLHQAAIQLELWTGQDAPVDAMRASVADVIG